MATNILLQFVPDGLNALQAQIANGDATRITRYELTEESITGTIWNPSVYYRQDNPQDIGAVSLYNAVDAPNAQQVLVLDLLLNQTVPLNTSYTSVNAGWVNSSTNPAIINLLNFCLFIYDPVSGVDVPFLIGTFLNIDTQLPQAVLKFSNNYISNLPGNVIDIFNNTKLTPTNPDSIQYEIVQRPDAQIRYINQGIELLPTPTANTPNAYVVNTYNILAWSNYYLWYFSNYYDEISDSSVIGVTGTTFNSPDLAGKLNIYPEEVFVEPNVIGEIYGLNGIMKKCFYITGVSGSTFSTNTTLPTFESGDMVKVFFSLELLSGKNFLKLITNPATDVLVTSAQLNGSLISFINSTTNLTGFDYKKTTDTNYTRVGMTYNDVLGDYFYILSGLDELTDYQYRAVGTDINNQFTSFGKVVQFTTGTIIPPVFDFQLNITGTVDGPSNIALNTTNIPNVVNGVVNNATGLMTATANNCASNSLEVEQDIGDPNFTAIEPLFAYNPYKLTIDPSTTSTSIVVTDSQSGLLTNGSQLIVDDGGTMKIVQTNSVVSNPSPIFVSRTNPTALFGNSITYDSSVNTWYIGLNSSPGLIKSTDSINWVEVTSNRISISSIKSNNNGTLLGIDNGPSLVRSINGGVTWQTISLPNNASVWPGYGSGQFTYNNGAWYVYALDTTDGNNKIYKSINDGLTFTEVLSFGDGNRGFQYMSSGDNDVVLFIFNPSGIFQQVKVTTNGGISWVDGGNIGTHSSLSTCLGLVYSNSTWFSLFQSGGIYKSINNGNTWSAVSTIGSGPYSSLSTNGTGYLIYSRLSGDGSIYQSVDNGANWVQGYTPFNIYGLSTATSGVSVGLQNSGTGIASSGVSYTCTALTSVFGTVPLSNAPTWCAKGGQVFQSAVYATTSPTPTYTTDTINSLTRSTDTLTITMNQRFVNGRYVRVKTIVNNQDIMSRYAANLYI